MCHTPVAHMVEDATLTWNWLMVRNAPRRLELSEKGWLSAFTASDWMMGTCAQTPTPLTVPSTLDLMLLL
jgi:hypothetical protein